MPFDRWKTIEYRGGVVTFRVPDGWVEEYEPEGGGTFYSEEEDLGTLRLNVITAESPVPLNEDSAGFALAGLAERPDAVIRSLPNANAYLSFTENEEQDGEALVMHYWMIANVCPPKFAQLAIFSFTLLASEAPAAEANVRQIERELLACRFTPVDQQSG